jgi:hypothetical protein
MTERTQSETVAMTTWQLCDVCGIWFDCAPENHWHEVVLEWPRPTWHMPTLTRLDVTRTMAWCGSGEAPRE